MEPGLRIALKGSPQGGKKRMRAGPAFYKLELEGEPSAKSPARQIATVNLVCGLVGFVHAEDIVVEQVACAQLEADSLFLTQFGAEAKIQTVEGL